MHRGRFRPWIREAEGDFKAAGILGRRVRDPALRPMLLLPMLRLLLACLPAPAGAYESKCVRVVQRVANPGIYYRFPLGDAVSVCQADLDSLLHGRSGLSPAETGRALKDLQRSLNELNRAANENRILGLGVYGAGELNHLAEATYRMKADIQSWSPGSADPKTDREKAGDDNQPGGKISNETGNGDERMEYQPYFGDKPGAQPPGSNDPPASNNPARDEGSLPENPAPRDSGAVRRVARGWLNQGRPEDARRVLDDYLDKVPDDSGSLLLRGNMRLNGKDYAGAQADASRVLAKDPSNQAARDLYGMAGMYLRDAIQLRKPVRGPDFESQGADTASGQREAALDSHAGKGQAPRFPAGQEAPGAPSRLRGYAHEAQLQMRIGGFREAKKLLDRAIEEDPGNASLYAMRAEALNRDGNLEGALLDVAEALKLDPLNAAALRQQAYAEVLRKNFERARDAAERAIEAEPGNAMGYVYLAMALEGMGRLEDALAAYRQAFALDPRTKNYLDEVLERSGKKPRQEAASATRTPAAGRAAWRLGMAALALPLLLLGLRGVARRAAGYATTRAPQEPEPAAGRTSLAPGSIVGGLYRIEGLLGRGGMGVVYEATDLALERRVALKRMTVPDSSPEYLERFLKEARLVAKLEHPNLVRIHAVAAEGGEPYLVFEYLDGKTLDALLTERGRVEPEDCLAVIKDICGALDYAHGKRVIHRDLKPANVMLASDGRSKVMDFGIAHQARTASVQTRTEAWGTPPYMAPEQEMGSVSRESDLYSLGVMTYELLTGQRPYEGARTRDAKLERRYEPASKLSPGLPPAVDAFLHRALDPDPAKRFRTGAEFVEAFKTALGTPARA